MKHIGYETIRLGLSGSQMKDGNHIVEHNLFEKCDGEIEIISIKASSSNVRFNTIRESYGYITMRHGQKHNVVSC